MNRYRGYRWMSWRDFVFYIAIFAIIMGTCCAVSALDKREAAKIPEQEVAPPKQEIAVVSRVEPVEPVSVEEVEETPAYTERDLELLALVIYQEAGGDACSDETRLMVGNVVMNRVADERFPDTIEEVLLQERQYGRLHWTGTVWPKRASQEVEAHAVARAYECAEQILNGVRVLPDDVIFQSEYILGEIVAEQDGFYFCRG